MLFIKRGQMATKYMTKIFRLTNNERNTDRNYTLYGNSNFFSASVQFVKMYQKF